jgi:hypothetical protein
VRRESPEDFDIHHRRSGFRDTDTQPARLPHRSTKLEIVERREEQVRLGHQIAVVHEGGLLGDGYASKILFTGAALAPNDFVAIRRRGQ